MKLEGVSNVLNNLVKASDTVLKSIVDGMDIARMEMENTAKMTAPWTDRTGNARNSISGSGVEKEGETYRIALAIGVDYGKWLELCNYGKYRIVWPTVSWEGNKLLGHFKI